MDLNPERVDENTFACDAVIEITMLGEKESLNVSVAGAIADPSDEPVTAIRYEPRPDCFFSHFP